MDKLEGNMRVEKQRKVFLLLFSTLIVLIFYMLLSSNGVILGNDPAVHFLKASEILRSGRISLSEIAWWPPQYSTLLAEYIIFTGASSFEHVIVLIKLLTATFNWLMVLSVYMLGKRLVDENVGIIASSLLLLCFPLYEINFWGGYPSLLSIVYMYLLLFYLSTKRKGLPDKIVAFFTAFSLVLTHQLAAFLTMAILVIYTLVALIFLRRSLTTTFVLAGLGALAAFLLWYVPVIMPYMNVFVSHIFFSEKSYLNLTWRVTPEVFIMSFGFIIVFAFLGFPLTFYTSKRRKNLEFYALLCLSLLVPLCLSQSYLFGILLPYDRFVYCLTPSAAVFSAAVTYIVVRYAISYVMNLNWSFSRNWLKVKAIALAFLVILLFASRFPVLTGRICEAVDYYSYLNPQSYNSAVWLNEVFPKKVSVVVSEKPGLFFGIVSGKPTIMEVNPIIEREANAEVILNLAYEVEHPTTLFRVYETPMPYELDQYNVLIRGVWRRAAFLFDEETSVCYSKDGKIFTINLPRLERRIFWDEEKGFRKLCILYSSSNEFTLTESITVTEKRIPFHVEWTFTPLHGGISFLYFNLSIHFDLFRHFEKAYVPGILYWESPWNKPSYVEVNRKWALVNFNPGNLPRNYVAVHDPVNGIFYAFKFEDFPAWGSLGVLSTNQIDALRLKYCFNASRNFSISYFVVAFSEESFPKVSLNLFDEVFSMNFTDNFAVAYRDYRTCVREKGVQFIVFDKEKFRKELLNNDFLQLVFSNNQYIVCKIKQ
ncbi:MAG: hypothetical protein N0A00_02685 [Candidatus Bathyarchaeota archaeon]|nr:hypothetical protein [Candidatus Bathyarchaeota archaeon]